LQRVARESNSISDNCRCSWRIMSYLELEGVRSGIGRIRGGD